MSYKEEEKEESEETILDHDDHNHPLYLTECSQRQTCDGCPRYIFSGDMMYICQRKCKWGPKLHEECAEMPRAIRLPNHYPQHTLIQTEMSYSEETILDHGCHDHPLSLTECRRDRPCDGCPSYIFSGEMMYICHWKCRWSPNLHEECVEMPLEIRLSIHDPQQALIQKEELEYRGNVAKCEVCTGDMGRFSYNCSSCTFQIHVGCAPNIGLWRSFTKHPSHPHQLTVQWKPGRSCSSRCDACGTIHSGNPYVCADCHYWVLESCANLPTTALYQHIHPHPLSLAFSLPTLYIGIGYSCNICCKGFFPKYWVYHCETCRYVVHINCAKTSIDKNAIAFPINSAEELIGRFVREVIGAKVVPHEDDISISKFKFHNHDHPLNLIPFSLHKEEEEEDGDIGDDELNCRRRSELICDWCTTPILEKKQSHEGKYYMSCDECKCFLHEVCYNLPEELPSHPLHYKDHTLILVDPPKLVFTYSSVTLCDICNLDTDGLIYKCLECSFKIDIKCASLPYIIKHAAHPRHHLKLLSEEYEQGSCVACGWSTYLNVRYKCEICEINMHASCALLPPTVTNPTWDRHPFELIFNAGVDQPNGFYCDVCEEEMNPELWMYHCRTCDFSFHPNCFPNVSGKYKNIVFGELYDVGTVHNHPLVYQLLTSKLHCDVCNKKKKYGCLGFQCASHECDFFMCFDPCGVQRHHTFRAVPQFRLTLG